MIPQPYATDSEVLAGSFTDEEARRLEALQRRCGDSPLAIELGLDPQRLEFARWLVRRGILNEGVEQE